MAEENSQSLVNSKNTSYGTYKANGLTPFYESKMAKCGAMGIDSCVSFSLCTLGSTQHVSGIPRVISEWQYSKSISYHNFSVILFQVTSANPPSFWCKLPVICKLTCPWEDWGLRLKHCHLPFVSCCHCGHSELSEMVVAQKREENGFQGEENRFQGEDRYIGERLGKLLLSYIEF